MKARSYAETGFHARLQRQLREVWSVFDLQSPPRDSFTRDSTIERSLEAGSRAVFGLRELYLPTDTPLQMGCLILGERGKSWGP